MVWEYVKSNLRHSFAVWEVGERVSVLLGFLVAAGLAALSLYGVSVVIEATTFQWFGVGLGLWFLFLVLVVTPYRLWAGQQAKVASLEARLEPKIDLFFSQDDPLCYHQTYRNNRKDDQAMYVAVVPRALSDTPVKGCRGFLNAVLLPDRRGGWQPTSFVNSLPLEWGGVGWEAVEIDNVTNQALNVFYVARIDPRVHPRTKPLLAKDHDLFHDKNNRVFRFDIVVKGEGVSPAQISLRAELGQAWNDLTVTRIEA